MNGYLDKFPTWISLHLPKDALNALRKIQFTMGTNFWNTLYKSLDRANPGSGNARKVSPKGQGDVRGLPPAQRSDGKGCLPLASLMILLLLWVVPDGSQLWILPQVIGKWQWYGHPGEGSIRNFERPVWVDRDAFRPLQRTQHLCRLMELVLKGLHWKICLIYLDDVIVMGHTFEEELERLKEVSE